MSTNVITSEEVNYLVFRYLQESGYVHTAFSFGYESVVNKSTIDGSQVPPGALLSFLQRGLNYVEIEATLASARRLLARRARRRRPATHRRCPSRT